MEVKVFSPNEFFKDELRSSWCQNIRTNGVKQHVPVLREAFNGKPAIQLIPTYSKTSGNEIDVSRFFVAAIPLTREWGTVDLHDCFNRMVVSLAINIESPNTCFINLELNSLIMDVEKSSNSFPLTELVEQTSGWQRVVVPMMVFDVNNRDFSTYAIRLFKIVCVGWSPIMLSDIRMFETDFFNGKAE